MMLKGSHESPARVARLRRRRRPPHRGEVTMGRQVGRNGRSKASKTAEEATKGAQILELVASGMTVREASNVVGVSAHWASQLYQRELQLVTDRHGELRRLMLTQDLETLRLLIAAHMPAAVGEQLVIAADGEVVEDPKGRLHVDLRQVAKMPPSHQSAKIVLSALDRRSKLLGLDAAIQVEISNSRVSEAVDDIQNLLDGAEDDDLAIVLELDARRDAR